MKLKTRKNEKVGLFLVGMIFIIFICSAEFVYAIKPEKVIFTKGPDAPKPWKNTVDAVSVVDISGSMEGEKFDEAKVSMGSFVDVVLKNPKSSLGLVVYSDKIKPDWCHELSRDNITLKTKVKQWEAIFNTDYNTCICCGVNKAVEFLNDSNTKNSKIMVVMSDGIANIECREQGMGDGKKDAIKAAKDAWEKKGIKVYTIGYGGDADNDTLKTMAMVGNGSYYFAELGGLEEIYASLWEAEKVYFGEVYEERNLFARGWDWVRFGLGMFKKKGVFCF